jgi:hypothetical protein
MEAVGYYEMLINMYPTIWSHFPECPNILYEVHRYATLRRLLVTAGVVPSSPILITLLKEALSSFETSVLTRATRRNIPEDAILHSHRRENLKSYLLTIINFNSLYMSFAPGVECPACVCCVF